MNKYFTWAWMTLGVVFALGQFVSAFTTLDRRAPLSIYFGVAILVFVYRHATNAKPLNRYMWVIVVTFLQFFQQIGSPRATYIDALVIAGGVGALLTVIVLAYDFVGKPLWQKFHPAQNSEPSTPALLLAAAEGDTAQIERLLTQGASADTLGPNGETALMLAIRNGKRDVVELLLAKGTDMHIKTPKGSTALSVAKHFKQSEIEGLLQGSQPL